MTSKFLKLFLLPALCATALMTACNKTDDLSEAIDNAIDDTLYEAQERGGLGKFGCYELVFPVKITLPSGTTSEFDSYEEIKDSLKNWCKMNPDSIPGGPGKPKHGHGKGHGKGPRGFGLGPLKFVYPISVITQDGEAVAINNETELLALRAKCADAGFGKFGPHGHGKHGLACFEFVFPLNVKFPDGTTATASDKEAFHKLLREWRVKNPAVKERPTLVFPVNVKLKSDGSTKAVNSKEELHSLKKTCKG
jgi:hypothetical protein